MLDGPGAPCAAYNSASPARPRPALTITRFVRCAPGGSTRRCYVDVMIPSDYIRLYWVAVHAAGDNAWIRLPGPSAERRAAYFSLPVRFCDAMGARAFEKALIAEVRRAYPDALGRRAAHERGRRHLLPRLRRSPRRPRNCSTSRNSPAASRP